MKTSQYGDKRKWNNKEKIGYKLDQTFGIILHAHDDVFFPFKIVTFLRTTTMPTSIVKYCNCQINL
jgi:hypothetical protein